MRLLKMTTGLCLLVGGPLLANTGFASSPPICTEATPSVMVVFPPSRQFIDVDINGVTDPDGDPITIIIYSIYQDEPVVGPGSGNFQPDGVGIGTSTASVRAERKGGDNGRVYSIGFEATDDSGNTCSGQVQVSVPPNGSGAPAVDDGPLFDSTASSP